MAEAVEPVSLHDAAYERYLAYAMSVITSRALPDVRDGLKPVQRRILYTMYHELSMHPSGRYRKCASVVGDVMGKYHPHGDSSIYEALVRMAQSFSLRAPLVDGQGNFGSLDGDPPAAMRYTECRLTAVAEELLSELGKDTVEYRPTYDGQRNEPIVLPAQFPHLLVNGVEGIAVGMATKIPPHNLGEVVDACVALIDKPDLAASALLKYIKGPDFPTGGEITTSRADLEAVYAAGHGSIRLQATWSVEKDGRKRLMVINSIPYGQNKSKILEKIGGDVEQKKLPQVTDVRDESTTDVRIVLELKADASEDQVAAWLFKHTDLAINFAVNMTVLIPTEKADVCRPERIDLRACLDYWLKFRKTTVQRRLNHDLRVLLARIEVLGGFETVFPILDEVIALIRKSEGKRDAAEKMIARWKLSETQTEAILELKLYRLARLEIELVREELQSKRDAADKLETLLASETSLWSFIKQELLDLKRLHSDKRRTLIGTSAKELTYDADAYIVKEDTYVVVTKDGWIKRQSSFSSLDKVRVREGDNVGWLIKANTQSTLTFFGDLGGAYVLRVDAIPATTGHGDPLQRHFSMGDGEMIAGVVSHDPRNRLVASLAHPASADEPPHPWGFAITKFGRVLQFPLSAHEDASTKNGRRYARLDDGDRVARVWATTGDELVYIASKNGHALIFPVRDVPVLKATGKGVAGVKLDESDAVFAAELRDPQQGYALELVDEAGKSHVITDGKPKIGARGDKGKALFRKGGLAEWTNREQTVFIGVAGSDEASA